MPHQRMENHVQALTIQSHDCDPFVVLKACGELDLHTQDEFERSVTHHLDTSPVVVDLGGVDFLAVSALRTLMVCHGVAGANGHELFYAEASQQALRLLAVAELDRVLPLRASVADVVCGSNVIVKRAGGAADQSVRELAQLDVG